MCIWGNGLVIRSRAVVVVVDVVVVVVGAAVVVAVVVVDVASVVAPEGELGVDVETDAVDSVPAADCIAVADDDAGIPSRRGW